ncbi:YD repeat-containing protein, partial [Prosthecobacter debontii]
TPLQPLPRTALTGVKDKPPITSTLSDVVAAIQAHPQASALLTATASSGSLGSTVMQAMSRTYLSGSTGRTSYQWTRQDRLAGVTMPDGTQHDYSYDYRAGRLLGDGCDVLTSFRRVCSCWCGQRSAEGLP